MTKQVTRGFSSAGFNSSEDKLIENYKNEGFKLLFYSARYHWGLSNIKSLEIITYTEGDLVRTKLSSWSEFEAEINLMVTYYNHYNKRISYEISENFKNNYKTFPKINGEIPEGATADLTFCDERKDEPVSEEDVNKIKDIMKGGDNVGNN